MAIALSQIMSAVRGSLGGITFYASRYSNIAMRARVVPTDPNTAYQQVVRTNMSAAVSGWQSLTIAQRASWSAYAANTPWLNALSQDVFLTGQAMYIAVRLTAIYTNSALTGADFYDAPCNPGLLAPPRLEYLPLPGGPPLTGFTLRFHNQDPSTIIRCSYARSSAQATSINFWKGPYLGSSKGSTSNIAIGGFYDWNVSKLVHDRFYFVRVKAISVIPWTRMSTVQHIRCHSLNNF